MTDSATNAKPAGPTPSGAPDERLAHRGPIQQLLTRPEIGALLGATGVWLLFWLVSKPFGTVGGTANFLDVAATIGLMAVPVALLMIGGEFDLSSGSMTGAAAMAVILLSSDTGVLGGAGLSLHLAVPLSLAFALAIGWFNGTLVEKTSLPSFIVTLGSFFILIGAKLGFAKLFTNKVIVEGLDRADAYEFWRNIFGASWIRNNHVWDGRDWAWGGLLVLGGVALLLGILELTYARSGKSNPAGIVTGVIGAVAGVFGFVMLLTQGGKASDWIWGIVTGAGVLVGVAGWCMARYKRADAPAQRSEAPPSSQYLIGGVVAVVAAILVALIMDSTNSDQLGFLGGGAGRAVLALGIGATGVAAVLAVLGRLSERYAFIGAVVTLVPAVSFMMTVQAARAVLFGGLALAGVTLFTMAGAGSRMSTAMSGLTAVAIAVLAFFIQSEGASRKIRVELFTALLLLALVVAALAVAGALSARRVTAPAPPDLGNWTKIGAGLGGLAAVISLIVEFAQGDGILYSIVTGVVKGAIVALIVYAVATAWKLLFTDDEGIGRSVVTVGLVFVLLGIAAKLLFITKIESETIAGTTRFGVSVLLFLAFACIGAWMLVRTQFGGWIFAVGGNKEAARSIGVPAARTKTTLFMLVSSAAWLTGMTIAFRLNSVQANVGDGNEFRYIIVAVVGGNLLTGGYGSALGAAIGALIWAMIQQGITFAGWNSDWRFLVLGALLLVAVLVNNYVRARAEKKR